MYVRVAGTVRNIVQCHQAQRGKNAKTYIGYRMPKISSRNKDDAIHHLSQATQRS